MACPSSCGCSFSKTRGFGWPTSSGTELHIITEKSNQKQHHLTHFVPWWISFELPCFDVIFCFFAGDFLSRLNVPVTAREVFIRLLRFIPIIFATMSLLKAPTKHVANILCASRTYSEFCFLTFLNKSKGISLCASTARGCHASAEFLIVAPRVDELQDRRLILAWQDDGTSVAQRGSSSKVSLSGATTLSLASFSTVVNRGRPW